MKLAQRQQDEVQGGNWSGEARGQTSEAEHESEPVGMLAASSASHSDVDDPYRGMSDGDMLEF